MIIDYKDVVSARIEIHIIQREKIENKSKN